MKTITLLLLLSIFSCMDTKPRGHKTDSQTSSDPVYTPTTYDGSNPFGVLVNQADGVPATLDTKLAVQKELGAPYARSTVVLTGSNTNLTEYKAMVASGFKVILNVIYERQVVNGTTQIRSSPTDMNEYKSLLSNALSGIEPELVVIENEEANMTYYNVEAPQYLKQIGTAIDILHARGIKVTNGGITRPVLNLIVYDDYRSRGMNNEADDYASRCMRKDIVNDLPDLKNHPILQQHKTRVKQLVEGYKNIPLDYINFHWYEPANERQQNNSDEIDTRAFKETVDCLRRITGKDAISNELGQHSTSPKIVQQMMQAVLEVKLPYAIWYSGDGGEGKAVAVNNGNGSLRPYGVAFRDFMKNMK